MAGHSKWANIKHRKAAQDAKKGKVFTKIARELTVAAKEGGGDPTANSRLRLALDKARQANMPKDNVDRAIKKGTGGDGTQHFEDIMYEAYGPSKVAILIKALTDNRNRTISEVRNVVSKRGGSMAEAGSVSWQFAKKGIIEVSTDSMSEDDAMMFAIDAGAEDVATDGDVYVITTAPSDFEAVRKVFEDKKSDIKYAEVTMKPASTVEISGEVAEKVLNFVDALEDLDDVQEVYGNYEVDDATMEGMN